MKPKEPAGGRGPPLSGREGDGSDLDGQGKVGRGGVTYDPQHQGRPSQAFLPSRALTSGGYTDDLQCKGLTREPREPTSEVARAAPN